MKKIQYALGIMMLGLLASCGGGEDANKATLTIEPQLGELGDYITITDQEAIVTLADEEVEGEAVKTIASSIAFNVNKGVASDRAYGFKVVVLDENHNRIAPMAEYQIEAKYDYKNGDYRYILVPGANRAQMKRSAPKSEWDETPEAQEAWNNIRTKGKYMVLTPYYDSAEYVSYGSDSQSSSDSEEPVVEADDDDINATADDDNDSSVSSSSSSTVNPEVEAAMKDFETAYKEYAAALKKMSSGDVTAIANVATYATKYQQAVTKLQSIKNLSAADMARVNEAIANATKEITSLK